MDETQTSPRADAGGVPVWCAHDKIVPLVQLVPNPRNPNRHPDKQIKLLTKVIQAQGWRMPITVSTRSGLIVKGHGRRLAAMAPGLPCAPVDYQHYGSEAEELADLMADNWIPELSNIDKQLAAEVLADIDLEDFDFELTGFTLDVFELDSIEELIDQEQEVEDARRNAETIKKKIAERLDRIAAEAPEKLNRAQTVILPAESGAIECFVLVDPATTDTIAELRRLADAGEISPLSALLKNVHPMKV